MPATIKQTPGIWIFPGEYCHRQNVPPAPPFTAALCTIDLMWCTCPKWELAPWPCSAFCLYASVCLRLFVCLSRSLCVSLHLRRFYHSNQYNRLRGFHDQLCHRATSPGFILRVLWSRHLSALCPSGRCSWRSHALVEQEIIWILNFLVLHFVVDIQCFFCFFTCRRLLTS